MLQKLVNISSKETTKLIHPSAPCVNWPESDRYSSGSAWVSRLLPVPSYYTRMLGQTHTTCARVYEGEQTRSHYGLSASSARGRGSALFVLPSINAHLTACSLFLFSSCTISVNTDFDRSQIAGHCITERELTRLDASPALRSHQHLIGKEKAGCFQPSFAPHERDRRHRSLLCEVHTDENETKKDIEKEEAMHV